MPRRVARELLGDLHDLLLVDHQAVGRAQDRAERLDHLGLELALELRVERGQLLLAVLAQREVGVRVDAHRARAVERERRRDVLEAVGLHQLEQGAHAAAVELEDAEGVAPGQQVVGGLVGHVLRQGVEVDVLAPVALHVGDGVVEDGEVAQPEEVHLDQAEGLAARVVELGDDLAVLQPAHDRDDVDERLAAHDDAGRVHAPLALEPLEALGGLDDLLQVRLGGDEVAELLALAVAGVGGVVDARERHALAHDVGRHRLGQLLADGEGVAHDPRGVLDGLLGLDGAVGDDLRDPLAAVLLGDVADHLAAPALVEVDVEVGQRGPLGVEEPLEDQPVRDRVEVGDLHGVGAHRAGPRATPRADPDAVALGPGDEVGDDEEVAGIPLGDDDLGLELGLGLRVVGDAAGEALAQAALHLLDEPALLVLAGRAGEAGHVAPLVLGERDVAHLGDAQGVVAGLGQLAPGVPHLGRALEVELVGVELEPGGVHHRRAGLHAQQRRVRLGVVGAGVVQVVGGDERHVELARQPDEVLHGPALDVEAVVHHLAVEVLLAEDVLEVGGRLLGRVVLPEPQPGLDLAGRAPAGGDQALAVAVEQLAVDPRPLGVDLVERGLAVHAEQVVQPGVVAGEQGHVRVGARAGDVVAGAGALVAPLDPGLVGAVGARRDVGLDADDRLDAGALGLLPELVGAEDVAVVGGGERRHPHLGGPGEQVTDARGTVEHGVLGVHVQVDERVGALPRRAGRRGFGGGVREGHRRPS